MKLVYTKTKTAHVGFADIRYKQMYFDDEATDSDLFCSRYMCSLSFFHYSEYLVTAIINPRSLSLDSFLLNHSVEYTVAAVFSWVEFTVEKLLVPGVFRYPYTIKTNIRMISKFVLIVCFFMTDMKQFNWLCGVGLFMVFCGDSLRKAAMLTAGSNFNHIVQNEKARSHVLVTSGVYAHFRHPSYVGWFYWSIGTQVLQPLLSVKPCSKDNGVHLILLLDLKHLLLVFCVSDRFVQPNMYFGIYSGQLAVLSRAN